MRSMVVTERLMKFGTDLNRRDWRVTLLVAIGTDATAMRLRPAWISISMV